MERQDSKTIETGMVRVEKMLNSEEYGRLTNLKFFITSGADNISAEGVRESASRLMDDRASGKLKTSSRPRECKQPNTLIHTS